MNRSARFLLAGFPMCCPPTRSLADGPESGSTPPIKTRRPWPSRLLDIMSLIGSSSDRWEGAPAGPANLGVAWFLPWWAPSQTIAGTVRSAEEREHAPQHPRAAQPVVARLAGDRWPSAPAGGRAQPRPTRRRDGVLGRSLDLSGHCGSGHDLRAGGRPEPGDCTGHATWRFFVAVAP